jgi:hypothetical protein
MAEQFTINRRAGYEFLGALTVTIECDPSALSGVKLGLAVRVAVKSMADLTEADLSMADLTRANLTGADLTRANLTGASLTRAYLTGANLTGASLTGADLTGANLSRAFLTGANLSGAYLSGAFLTGAKIKGEPVTRCFARIVRDDGYGFVAFTLESGGVKIIAGCRWFTVAEFRAHVAAKYPGSEKATETLWIIDAIERRASALGIALEAEQVAA